MLLSLFIHFVHKTTIWYNIKIKDTLLYYILLLYIYIYISHCCFEEEWDTADISRGPNQFNWDMYIHRKMN